MYVFEIRFSCLNCGNEWSEQFETGDEVKESVLGVFLKSNKCTGEIDCPYCRTICCPVCNSKRLVVVKRKPLGV